MRRVKDKISFHLRDLRVAPICAKGANRGVSATSKFIGKAKIQGVSMRSLALSFLLLCSSLVFAQMQQNRTANQTSDQNSQKVQGCISGSAGNYTLTDSSGQTFQLAGDTSKLSDNVGKKVEITGTSSSAGMGSNPSSTGNPSSNPNANPSYPGSGTNPSNPSSSTSGTSAGMGGPTLTVSSVQPISGSCPSK